MGKSLRILLVYPPKAYPFIPYLAPFLLKGHVQSASMHSASTEDLNIAFHRWMWTPDFGQAAIGELESRGQRSLALVAELLARDAPVALAALRDRSTFDAPGDVRAYARLLKFADRILDALDDPSRTYPRGLGEWTAVLAGLDGSIVERFVRDRVEAGVYDGYDVVGLSVAYLEQVPPALLLARALKRRRPAIRVVIGGGAVTHLLPDLVRDRSFFDHVDYCVPYEGELTLVELLDRIASGRPPPPNVMWADGGRVAYRKNLAERRTVEAEPDFSDLRDEYPTPAVIYPLLTSKGCYWGKCAFCTHHEGYGQGYSRFSDDIVRGSVSRLIDTGARAFYLADEALPPRTLTRLAEVFDAARARLPDQTDLGWMAEARMEKTLVNTPAVALLKRSGCRLLVSGIESGCQDIADAMKKGIDLELAARFARECYGIGIQTGWMFFIGFPGETEEQSRDTFRYIERNAAYLDSASIGVFNVERGSPLWEDPAAYGIDAILGDRTQAYPRNFDVRMQDGSIRSFSRLSALLGDLHREFSHLASLFRGVGDRALSYFFPPGHGRCQDPPPVFRWTSGVARGEAELDVDLAAIQVRRGAS